MYEIFNLLRFNNHATMSSIKFVQNIFVHNELWQMAKYIHEQYESDDDQAYRILFVFRNEFKENDID